MAIGNVITDGMGNGTLVTTIPLVILLGFSQGAAQPAATLCATGSFTTALSATGSFSTSLIATGSWPEGCA